MVKGDELLNITVYLRINLIMIFMTLYVKNYKKQSEEYQKLNVKVLCWFSLHKTMDTSEF
jgi:hypothetical protein